MVRRLIGAPLVNVVVVLVACIPGPTHGAATAAFSHVGRGSVDAVQALVTRVLGLPPPPGASGMAPLRPQFELEMVPQCGNGVHGTVARSGLCFILAPPTSASGAVAKISATSAVELTRGIATYLRAHCNMSFSWQRTGGNQVRWPAVWPVVATRQTVYRNTEYSYFQNVVASSYTFAFYDWSEWEALIDWQALTGINLALAYTGQEEVYRKAFGSVGVTESECGNWSNGPAWLAWSRGQSMHGVGSDPAGLPGGPALGRGWMLTQWKLQKQILTRMRSLGVVPVLPAFQGNVPPVVASLFPDANISVQGSGRHYAAWLDAADPLFQRIADVYMKTLIADFGTDSWYEADGYFAAGRPPWLTDSAGATATARDRGRAPSPPLDPAVEANAAAHAKHAYAGMTRTDPNAIWLYQGWILGGQYSYIHGMGRAIPQGHLVVSDMWCEFSPIWSSQDHFSFYGIPFIWGVLHNFGGNVGMWGSVDTLNSGPFDAFANATSIAGVGIFPEGIDQVSMRVCVFVVVCFPRR
jgi:alpha-N-acetylglucosaminidase